mmetsp:Transcript_33535/g.51546  ORF Transcript_33535/g.51546 Transcript_33535/m.51546 type:complete len:157 (-) Transcript_33535:585-1055(-)
MSHFVIAVLIGSSSAYKIMHEADHEFLKFVAEHGRSYGTREEFEFRAAVFKENYDYIQKVNAEDRTYKLGINFMADRTEDEMKKYRGYLSDLEKTRREPRYLPSVNDLDDLDYREQGAVTPVKNQGECGASYAFAVAGTMETFNFWKTGKLVQLSE